VLQHVGDYVLEETFFLFELEGVDMVLGMTWLAILGEVKVNWQTLTMSFLVHGRKICIQGDPTLIKTLINPQVLKKEREVAALSFFLGN